jgi:hypothetical protein
MQKGSCLEQLNLNSCNNIIFSDRSQLNIFKSWTNLQNLNLGGLTMAGDFNFADGLACLTRCQFHQHFTQSLYARRSQKRKNVQLSHLYIFMLLESTSVKAVIRVDEIEPRWILVVKARKLIYRRIQKHGCTQLNKTTHFYLTMLGYH